jgi:hypothetical protein
MSFEQKFRKMKLSYFFLLVFCICLTNVVESQKKIVLEGLVLDFETKSQLVYAHIYSKSLSVGTFTNSEGRFVLVVPESAKNGLLTVSCIGYYESEMSVSSFNGDTIFLMPKTNVLEEVEIISEYKPKEILKKVYKKRKSIIHTRNNTVAMLFIESILGEMIQLYKC